MDITNDRLLESLLREKVAYKLGLTVYELDLLDWNGAIVKCGVWRSCSSLLMSLHFFHSIDEANIFHHIR